MLYAPVFVYIFYAISMGFVKTENHICEYGNKFIGSQNYPYRRDLLILRYFNPTENFRLLLRNVKMLVIPGLLFY